MEIKSKLEIAEAVEKIKLTPIGEDVKIARVIADEAIKEYSYDLTEDTENQTGLKRIIEDAIVKGMHKWTEDFINH